MREIWADLWCHSAQSARNSGENKRMNRSKGGLSAKVNGVWEFLRFLLHGGGDTGVQFSREERFYSISPFDCDTKRGV